MKKTYISNCQDSFDENGDCVVDKLPYRDATDFAQAEEEATQVGEDFFLKNVDVGEKKLVKNKILLHDVDKDVFMIYDDIKDIHYFYI